MDATGLTIPPGPGAKVKFRARTSRCEGNECRASLVMERLFGGLNEMGAGKPGAHEVSTLVQQCVASGTRRLHHTEEPLVAGGHSNGNRPGLAGRCLKNISDPRIGPRTRDTWCGLSGETSVWQGPGEPPGSATWHPGYCGCIIGRQAPARSRRVRVQARSGEGLVKGRARANDLNLAERGAGTVIHKVVFEGA